jgi:hypothetical protein
MFGNIDLPEEFSIVSVNSGATLIAAPGVGNRIRVYYIDASTDTTTGYFETGASVGGVGVNLNWLPSTAPRSVFNALPKGLALDENTGISIGTTGGSGGSGLWATMLYTVESV